MTGGHFPARKSETAFFSLAAVSLATRRDCRHRYRRSGLFPSGSFREAHVQVDSLLVLAPGTIQAGIKSVSGAPAPVGRNAPPWSTDNDLATAYGQPQAEPLKVLPRQALKRQHLLARLNGRVDLGRNHQRVQAAQRTCPATRIAGVSRCATRPPDRSCSSFVPQ